MANLLSLSTARPKFQLTQSQALKFIRKNIKMRRGTAKLYEKVLSDPAIKYRRFSLDSLNSVLETNPDRINRRFEKESVELASKALRTALKKADIDPLSLDFVAVSTCTGYLCPGISSRLIESCGLRRDVRCLDIVGMGCGSAIPALESAHNFVQSNPGALAASVSVEICSAATFWGDSADLVVSNSIFADGAAASVVSTNHAGSIARIKDFESVTHPERRETLRFVSEKGRLRNVLSKDVPSLVAESLKPLVRNILKRQGIHFSQVSRWILHSGGKKVLDAVQQSLNLSDDQMNVSRRILKRHGNLSSPTVLYGLNEIFEENPGPKPGQSVLLLTFGAGFSAYACLLETA